MLNIALIKIYNELVDKAFKDPDSYIAFYETHEYFLNNIENLDDSKDLEAYLKIVSWYSSALRAKHRYKIMAAAIDKALSIIDVASILLGYNLAQNNEFQNLLFNKAFAKYNSSDYNTAYPIFKKLSIIDPENDLYNIWLKACKLRYLYKKFIWLTYPSLIIFLAGAFLKKFIPRPLVLMLSIIGGLGLLCCFGFEWYLKREMAKSN